jgi:hypothetical protein
MADSKVLEMKSPEEETSGEHIASSMDDLAEIDQVEYATIEGFLPGKTLRIGSLTAGDLIAWSESNDGPAKRTAGLRLIIKSLVGPPPSNIRYANDEKNIAVFRQKRHNVTERIVKEILKLNGMTVKTDEATKND